MGRGAAEIRVSSRLDADPAAVWERVTTPMGINDEMRPIMRISVPAGVDGLDPERIEPRTLIGFIFRHRHRRLRRRFGGSRC